VLLVHGWQDDSSLWSPLMLALQGAGASFVAFDLPAHGFSEGERGQTFEVADAVHCVARELGPVRAVVAHSFAGGAAGLAVSEGLAVRRLVLVTPPLWPPDASRFHRIAQRRGFPVEVGDRAFAEYTATTRPERAGYDVRRVLAGLELPVLVVSSLDDSGALLDQARALVPQLARGELFEVHGPGHRATAYHPRVIARIIEFLESARAD
jgi:pimeloyl-ACP methyl ester carboxylesterase